MSFLQKKRNRNILIVDDETDVLDLLKMHLESQGWVVITVSSSSKAFEQLRKKAFFLILTDIAMPEVDGYEFINKIKKKKIPSQIALITGFGYNPKHTLVKINAKRKYPIFFKPFQFKKPGLRKTVQSAWVEYHKDL